jgi:hypothetical protein
MLGASNSNNQSVLNSGPQDNTFQPSIVVPIAGSGLTENDYSALQSRWIDRTLADRALLRRVDSLTGAQIVGRRAGDYAGILIPYFHPGSDRVREYRLRRDQPDYEYDSTGNLRERQSTSVHQDVPTCFTWSLESANAR